MWQPQIPGGVRENARFVLWSLAGITFVFLLWTLSGALIYATFGAEDEHGTFGDMFGAVNALFSGWAFLGVIVAIILQKQELEEQRKEIRFAREAHEQSAAALSEQARIAQFHAQLEALNLIVAGYTRDIEAIVVNHHAPHDHPTNKRRNELAGFRSRYEVRLRELIDQHFRLKDGIRVAPVAEPPQAQ